MPIFKTNLKQLMLNKSAEIGQRLIQKDVADATGLSMPTISRWYQGSVDRLEATTVDPLLIYFGCSFNQLVEFVGSSKSEEKQKESA